MSKPEPEEGGKPGGSRAGSFAALAVITAAMLVAGLIEWWLSKP